MKFHLTIKSSNRKTGCMPVSTSPAATCPTSCPFKGKGCYAEGGPLKMHWDKVSQGKRGEEWSDFLSKIRSLPSGSVWRHNQSGDLRGSQDLIDTVALSELVSANQNKRGYTYTHYPVVDINQAAHNRQAIKEANENGFTINLSAESLIQADRLFDLNIGPVVITLPSTNGKNTITPKGRPVIVCPAIISNKVTCAQCKLCAKRDRKTIIGFTAHGFKKNSVDKELEK